MVACSLACLLKGGGDESACFVLFGSSKQAMSVGRVTPLEFGLLCTRPYIVARGGFALAYRDMVSYYDIILQITRQQTIHTLKKKVSIKYEYGSSAVRRGEQ